MQHQNLFSLHWCLIQRNTLCVYTYICIYICIYIYACCRSRIWSLFLPFGSRIWSPGGDQILLLAISALAYSGFVRSEWDTQIVQKVRLLGALLGKPQLGAVSLSGPLLMPPFTTCFFGFFFAFFCVPTKWDPKKGGEFCTFFGEFFFWAVFGYLTKPLVFQWFLWRIG